MSRLETVRENWAEITNKLLRDKQLLAHFLRFSAGMYKQSFSDAALIYQQNPYATKVATLETWNKLGRLVNRGERSIICFIPTIPREWLKPAKILRISAATSELRKSRKPKLSVAMI